MIPVQVRLTKKLLDMVDDVISTGLYSNRSQVIRSATREMLLKANQSRTRDTSSGEDK